MYENIISILLDLKGFELFFLFLFITMLWYLFLLYLGFNDTMDKIYIFVFSVLLSIFSLYFGDIYIKKVKPTKDENTVTIDGLMYQNQPFSQQDKENYDNQVEGGRVWTWEGAKNYCDNLTLGGKSDWRLPQKDELMKLGSVQLYNSYGDYKNHDEWRALHLEKWKKWFEDNKDKRIKNSKGYEYFIRQEFVENMPPLNGKFKGVSLWYTTEYNNNSSIAWRVNFIHGYNYWFDKSNESYALCVRVE